MAVSDPMGLVLGWVGLERRSGERVGAPGRVRVGEGGGDGEWMVGGRGLEGGGLWIIHS